MAPYLPLTLAAAPWAQANEEICGIIHGPWIMDRKP